MTDRIDLRSGVRPALLVTAIFTGAFVLAACTSQRPAPTPHLVGSGGEVQGVGRNTGSFPNLNVPPAVAAEQLTPEQKEAKLGQLGADKQRQAAAGAKARPTVDPTQLSKIGATHAEEALKSIEGN